MTDFWDYGFEKIRQNAHNITELRDYAGGFDKGLRTLLTLKEMELKNIGFGCTAPNNNSADMLSFYQLSKSPGLEFATAANLRYEIVFD